MTSEAAIQPSVGHLATNFLEEPWLCRHRMISSVRLSKYTCTSCWLNVLNIKLSIQWLNIYQCHTSCINQVFLVVRNIELTRGHDESTPMTKSENSCRICTLIKIIIDEIKLEFEFYILNLEKISFDFGVLFFHIKNILTW